MNEHTPEAPFPDACLTGKAFITPCCTAGVFEFRADSTPHLASHVAGHSWSAAWPCQIGDIDDDGTIVEAEVRSLCKCPASVLAVAAIAMNRRSGFNR